MKTTAERLILLLGGLLTLVTVLGYLGSVFWFFDILAYWRFQYTVILLLLLVVGLFVIRPRERALWLLPALLLNLGSLAPYFLPGNVVNVEDAGLKVLAINIKAETNDMAPLAAYLVESEPDIVVIIEAQPKHLERLDPQVLDDYPHILNESREGYFGIVLLSRFPIQESQVHRLGVQDHASIEAVIDWQGDPVTIYGVHLHPPLSQWGTIQRDTERDEMATVIGGIEGPQVLLGDFNATPWTYTVTGLADAGKLRHATRGFGSWPTWWVGTRLIGVPYDHILVSPELAVEDFVLGPDVGSDHRPVMAELHLWEQIE